MAERATVARPYAKAAFAYARESNAIAPWSLGLRTAAEVVIDPRIAALAKDPQWSAGALVSRISELADGTLDPGMQNFLRVLAENHRLLLLPEIVAHYELLRSALENTVNVEVVSAVPLNAAQEEKLNRALNTRLKRDVRMHNTVDKSLLGGAVIRAGDLVIDGSLKGRLERLATELGS